MQPLIVQDMFKAWSNFGDSFFVIKRSLDLFMFAYAAKFL